MNVRSIRQTCEACPSQWEGHLDDGRMVYVRYRWGYLSVRVSPVPTDDVFDAVGGDEVFGAGLGDGLDGCLSYDELRAATPGIVWPVSEWGD